MKFLPSAADSSTYGWEILLLTLLAALLPATAIFVWAVFVRKRGRRKSRRRHRRFPAAANPRIARTNGASAAYRRESTPGESKS